MTNEQLNEMVQQWPFKARPFGLRYDGGGFYNLDGAYFTNEHAFHLHIATGMLYAEVGVTRHCLSVSQPRDEFETMDHKGMSGCRFASPFEAVHDAVMYEAYRRGEVQ